MSKQKKAASKMAEEGVVPEDLILQIFNAYETHPDQPRWIRESERWYELVACILTTVAEPEMAPEAIRELTEMLEWAHLLDIDLLGSLGPIGKEDVDAHPVVVTLTTLLRQGGFNEEESRKVVSAIIEVARGFRKHYQGKVQHYLRQQGERMLEEASKTFAFSQLNSEETHHAFSLWFQNALNIPLPTADPITERACARLGTDYSALVEAADAVGVNVALLDNALRAYWEEELELTPLEVDAA
jgi:hypothetical protein